ncbi:MAG: leucine-rich repeat domain-containing protein [Clostridia bacterium]|nr:leucine-rich repeat domain-containing protein [Clostridia bacterium]
MKRALLFLFAVLPLFLLLSCGKTEEYRPIFTCQSGFSYEGGVITGTVYTLDTLHLRELVETEDDLLLTADFSADYYSEDGEIPLKAGKNEMVLTFMGEAGEAKIPVVIEVILLGDLRVEMLAPEKNYRIGEHFDPTTIAVIGTKKDGTEVTITDYIPEYEFSTLGESRVGIDIGGFYESFTVSVTDEYRPTLSNARKADGVSYVIREAEAILEYAEDVHGFFAVPKTVVYEGKEFPVTEIGVGAFEGTAITGVMIPEGVRVIADSAFADCVALTWIELPSSLTEIGKMAFLGCSSLKTVSLPDGISEIQAGTFRGCEALFRAELSDSLTSIGKDAFFGCEALTAIEFPVSLREIGESAFEGCAKLKSAVIGTLTDLGARAFAKCESLSVFAVGDVKTMGGDVFAGSPVTLYLSDAADFSTLGVENVIRVSDEPYLIECPTTLAIEDGYPHASLLAVFCKDGVMYRLKDFEITYPTDACGSLTATLSAEGFSHSFPVFITYTEPLAMDTDSRGAVYALDPATMTATLVSVPTYVRRSSVYRPENKALFLVPTHLSREDGIYTVTEVAEGAFDAVENVTEFFIPRFDF